LGKVLSKCNQTGDFGEAALMEYELGWRAKLEENLYRNWLAKNKLVTLSDHEFDDIIQILAEVGVTKLSVRAILKVLKETRPELVAKSAEFIGRDRSTGSHFDFQERPRAPTMKKTTAKARVMS